MQKTRHTTYRSLRLVHPFLYSSRTFYPTPKILCFQYFLIDQTPLKVPLRLSIPNCISIGSAAFTQLTAESLYFAMCVNNALTRDLRNNTTTDAIENNRFTALLLLKLIILTANNQHRRCLSRRVVLLCSYKLMCWISCRGLRYDTIRYDTMDYTHVRPKADQ